jgi:hypothetical protein
VKVEEIMHRPEPERSHRLEAMTIHSLMIELSNEIASGVGCKASEAFEALGLLPHDQLIPFIGNPEGWPRLSNALASTFGDAVFSCAPAVH